MRPAYRWVIAILIALVLLIGFVPLYRIGVALGWMATDSCSNLPGGVSLWLEVVWPIVLVATALTAFILIIKQARWRWVWLCLFIGLMMSICCYLSWFPLLSVMC
jgi:hypothetical protein